MLKLSFNLPLVLFLLLPSHIIAVGYSYTRFEGPVAGPEHKILVPDIFGQGSRIDYVAKPEYNYEYGVEDGKTRVLHNHKERRDGDEVVGVYSVVDPDGTLRVVKYTADNVNGFQAKVITNGITTIYGHNNGDNDDDEDDDDVEAIKQQVQHDVAGNNNDEDNDKTHYQVHEDYDEDHSEETYSTDDDDDDDEDGQDTYDESSEEGYEEISNRKEKTVKSNSENEYENEY